MQQALAMLVVALAPAQEKPAPPVLANVETTLPSAPGKIRQLAFDGDPKTYFASARGPRAGDHFTLVFDRPVADLIPERAANTAILAFTALLFATLVGLPLGVVSGSRPAGFLPGAIRGVSLVMLSMPPLLTSLFLVFAAARTGWLPVGGMTSTTSTSAGDLLRHLVVPAAALALPLAALFERLQSQAMSDVIAQPYMLATSKPLS